ncbi:MAG: M23 family metallopeptidase [Eubacterium sp.]|nr:M23 family metallopeptidase [Eubacterium sp.]
MYRSPFKAASTQTTAFKKPGSWAAGYHTGVDRVCSNTSLVSPANGTVQRNKANDKNYGNFIIITTDDGKSILMAHMKSQSKVKVGAKIKAGDPVGTMGATGNATGPHLHIEVENSKTWAYNTKLLNPDDYIDWNMPEDDNKESDTMNEAKTYKNGSTAETVYADTAKKTKIGSLDPYEKCTCFGKFDGMYLVNYKVDGTSNYKCGFVAYNGGL